MEQQSSTEILSKLGLGRAVHNERSEAAGIKLRYLHDHRAKDEVDEYRERLSAEDK
ncbi:MAG: hypothetical protein ACLQEQ_08355 [Nitrososphaerales archaeon]